MARGLRPTLVGTHTRREGDVAAEQADRPGLAPVARLADAVVSSLPQLDGADVDYEVVRRDRQTNQVAEIHLDDGRVLVLKRAGEAWAAARFRTSRRAADLLRRHTDVLAPEHVDLPELGEGLALAYWWIDLPTLDELHEGPEPPPPPLLRSCGSLMARMHTVGLDGFGALADAGERSTTLAGWLERELDGRLRSGMEAAWPDAVPLLDEALDGLAALGMPDGAVLVHGDLFDQNLLCARDGEPRCVGVLDLEDASAGPREADLAKLEILHGPLFNQPWEGDWVEEVRERYVGAAGAGAALDTGLVTFFRAYELLNMGYHAAHRGWADHAAELRAAVTAELGSLGAGRSHRRALRAAGAA